MQLTNYKQNLDGPKEQINSELIGLQQAALNFAKCVNAELAKEQQRTPSHF